MFSKLFLSVLMISTAYLAEASVQTSSYQEEFIFLTNQLTALQKRKKQTLSQLGEIESGLRQSVQSLSLDLAKAEAQNEILKTRLSTFEEDRTDEERNLKKVDVVKSQMQEFVSSKGHEPTEDLSDLNSIILSYLNKGAEESFGPGVAYNQKGVKEEGQIYTLGHVASYFVNGEKYIPLATNSSKTGMMFTENTVSKDLILQNNGEIRQLPVSLKDGELIREKSLGQVLRQKLEAGGAVGYVILLLGLVGLIVAFIRYNLIKSYSTFKSAEITELVERIQRGNIDGAKKLLYEQRTTPINQFVDLLLSCRHKTDEVYETIVVSEISKIQSRVSKYGPYLLVLAAVAPLLGLLGTVTGMIGTFDMITIHGTGNPKILSGGIKEALVTTQMGLIVAIPCILAGNYLSSQAFKVVNKFEEVASSIPKG
jgi:biopolymer transport protein ExbB